MNSLSSPPPVVVRVPGSTSNCGAGFDTLGLALQLYNTVTLTATDGAGGRPARDADGRAQNLVEAVVNALQSVHDRPVPGFTYAIAGEVPVSRGLGSSVTVLAGVLAGLNHWLGTPLDRTAMARLLTRIEGHPDNAAAGVWGGFCISRCGATPAEFMDLVRVELPSDLKFVVASPGLEIATKGSRGFLPAEVRHLDAVRSINSAAFLTAALVAGDYDKLRGAAEDFMHEPFRLPGIAGAAESIRAGLASGALTGWLSGSGSSVLCVAGAESADAVAHAMQYAFEAEGQACQSRILAADNQGLQVMNAALPSNAP